MLTATLFMLTTLLTVYLFYRAVHFNRKALVIILGWLLLQSVISLTGFYQNTHAVPPRFGLLIIPPLLLIIVLLVKGYHQKTDAAGLTLLHIVRVPVEIVLYSLYSKGTIPHGMTFEGANPDMLSGLTAPLIWYFGFVKRRLSKWVILLWNIVCLGLLLNIVIRAVLSAPSPFQQLAFEQPNTALVQFPYIWLPCCVVPLVLVSHLAVIMKFRSSAQLAW